MSLTILYTVHGATIENETDRANGWNDSSLTKLGIDQAKELGEEMKGAKFDEIISSDLVRAQQTAEIAFPGAIIRKDERLREADYGDFTNGDHSFKDQMEYYVQNTFPNGESYKDVENRMAELLRELTQTSDGKTVVFVAHQGPQLALEVIANGKSWPEAIAGDWRKIGAWQPCWVYTIP